jgi:hypothetical protein
MEILANRLENCRVMKRKRNSSLHVLVLFAVMPSLAGIMKTLSIVVVVVVQSALSADLFLIDTKWYFV